MESQDGLYTWQELRSSLLGVGWYEAVICILFFTVTRLDTGLISTDSTTSRDLLARPLDMETYSTV